MRCSEDAIGLRPYGIVAAGELRAMTPVDAAPVRTWRHNVSAASILLVPFIQGASFFTYGTNASFLIPLAACLTVSVSLAISFPDDNRPLPNLNRLARFVAGSSLVTLGAFALPEPAPYGEHTILRGVLIDVTAMAAAVLMIAAMRMRKRRMMLG